MVVWLWIENETDALATVNGFQLTPGTQTVLPDVPTPRPLYVGRALGAPPTGILAGISPPLTPQVGARFGISIDLHFRGFTGGTVTLGVRAVTRGPDLRDIEWWADPNTTRLRPEIGTWRAGRDSWVEFSIKPMSWRERRVACWFLPRPAD